MTREIELYKIGETYIKFDFEFSEFNKSKVKEAYLSQVSALSKEYLRNEKVFKISIEYEKGSLKTRIVIWASALYMGIANYGSFRAGLREVINDVRHFSEVVIDRIDDGPRIDQNDIIRTEKRLGLPGRLKELYDRINAYERNLNNLSNVEQQTELVAIKTEISSLIQLLSEQDKAAFLADLDDNYSQNLPNPNQRRTTYLINRYALKPEDDIEFIDQ